MKVLLTGAKGFLGKYILDTLLNHVDLFTIGRHNSDFNIDLSNTFNLSDTYDLVIHNAGKAHTIPKNKNEDEEFYKVNVLGTENLLNSFNTFNKPSNFIFISSVSVYGLNFGINIDENTKLMALDPYGKSKILAENIIQKWCIDNNIKCTILRLPLVVGKNPPGNLKSMIKAIKNRYYFNIDNGMARKSMVLAEDVAKFIIPSSNIPGIYNLTDGYHPSFNELSSLIGNQLYINKLPNIDLKLAKIIAKIGDIFGHNAPINSSKLSKITTDLTFSDLKARSTFKWNPSCVLENFIIK